MVYSSQMAYGTLRTFDASTLSGTYQAASGALDNPASIVKIVNYGTTDVTVSVDGTTDHDFVPSNAFTLYDVTGDSPNSASIFLPKGTQFFFKGTAGTGTIYIVHLYVVQR